MKARYLDLQKHRLIRGEISRRQFIRSALATGLGFTSAATIASAAEAQRPRAGGVLVIDPRGADTTFAHFSALTEILPDGSLVGELAESWEVDAQAMNWHITLRRDVTFHSGRMLSSADVVASLSRQRNGLLAGVEEISADGELGVSLSFASPVPDLPLWLSDAGLAIRSDCDGTGPYLIPSGEGVVAQRHRSWFKPARGHFEGLLFAQGTDLGALRVGQVHLIAEIAPDELVSAESLGLATLAQVGTSCVAPDGGLARGRLTQDWAARAGLAMQDDLVPTPDLLAHVTSLQHEPEVARDAPLDGGRLFERWWFA